MSSLDKPEPRAKEKARLDRAKAKAWRYLQEAVYSRDDGRCRACGRDAWALSDVHHIRYRSAGGADTMQNCILLCRPCHNDEHEHLVRITGTADDLTIERR